MRRFFGYSRDGFRGRRARATRCGQISEVKVSIPLNRCLRSRWDAPFRCPMCGCRDMSFALIIPFTMGVYSTSGRRLSWIQYTGWHSGLAIYLIGCEMLLASEREGYLMGASMTLHSVSDNAIYRRKYARAQTHGRLPCCICYCADYYSTQTHNTFDTSITSHMSIFTHSHTNTHLHTFTHMLTWKHTDTHAHAHFHMRHLGRWMDSTRRTL